MDSTEKKGSWIEQKCRLKMKFTSLTENKKMIEDGKSDEVLDKLELKLGKSKDELRRIIDSL